MGISINSRSSGFRKWSEAHLPKPPEAVRPPAGAEDLLAVEDPTPAASPPRDAPSHSA